MARYISTRGEAPALGFCDVMLTGLARDGGLYVPESWPQLSSGAIAALFGRPYWDVAVEVIRPFVGGEISDAELGRMANEAYASFRHPAVVPLRQAAPHDRVEPTTVSMCILTQAKIERARGNLASAAERATAASQVARDARAAEAIGRTLEELSELINDLIELAREDEHIDSREEVRFDVLV